jgi:hypothetical protein
MSAYERSASTRSASATIRTEAIPAAASERPPSFGASRGRTRARGEKPGFSRLSG